MQVGLKRIIQIGLKRIMQIGLTRAIKEKGGSVNPILRRVVTSIYILSISASVRQKKNQLIA